MTYYDEISKGYNRLHSEEQMQKAELIKKTLALKGLLLDVGAGTGLATGLFSGRAECIALDPAKKMLSQFPGLKVVARAELLPFKDACFDSVVSLTALHHADLTLAKAEIDRVSKKHAAIAVSFLKPSKKLALAKQAFKEFRQINQGKDLLFARP